MATPEAEVGRETLAAERPRVVCLGGLAGGLRVRLPRHDPVLAGDVVEADRTTSTAFSCRCFPCTCCGIAATWSIRFRPRGVGWPALPPWCVADVCRQRLIRWATVDLHYAIDHYSLFPLLIGLALLLGGWRALALGVALDRLPGVHGPLAGLRGGHAQPSLAEDCHHRQRFCRFKPWAYRPWPRATPSSCSASFVGRCRGVQRDPHVDVVLCDLRRGPCS